MKTHLPNPKKSAHEAAKKLLDDRMKLIRSEMYCNRYSMHQLVHKQTTLKRELAELGCLLRALDPKKPNDTKGPKP